MSNSSGAWPSYKYEDVIVEKKGQIGIIKLNRPKSLNSFGGKLMAEMIHAIKSFDSDPETVFTVLTGEGRFFSAGADVRGSGLDAETTYANETEKKLAYMLKFSPALEMLRSIIDHKKVFVLALNGPGVGGGGAWFQGIADIVLAAEHAYLQVPFSALGLVPENGSALNFAQSIGVHRANDFFIFGRKLSAQELEHWGLVNKIFPTEGFHDSVVRYLEEHLKDKDGKSMMEAKRLMNAPLRDGRMLAVYTAMDALSQRFADGAPMERFAAKKAEMEAKSKKSSKL